MGQSRQQTRAAAGAAAVTARSGDCAHLHSAFGPGCPHCWTATTPAATAPAAASSGNQAEAA